MNRYEVSGLGVVSADQEGDRVELGEDYVWMSRLAERAGIEVVETYAASCFAEPDMVVDRGDPGLDAYLLDRQREVRAEYRAESGREFPRVYRMRLVIEAEELSDDEAAAYWRERQARAWQGGGR